MKMVGKVFSVPVTDFVFDFITELIQWAKQNAPLRSLERQFVGPYQLVFLRKLWLNVQPGRDKYADELFHYPQEVAKYLSGYYRLPKELIAKMAALIYVVQYGKNLSALQRPHEILKFLIPEDVLPAMKCEGWKTEITNQVKALLLVGVDISEAKLQFLLLLQEQEMFGSTFFVVQQTSDDMLPELIYLAINLRGLHIIDPRTKVRL